jgi:hypothetical protein
VAIQRLSKTAPQVSATAAMLMMLLTAVEIARSGKTQTVFVRRPRRNAFFFRDML